MGATEELADGGMPESGSGENPEAGGMPDGAVGTSGPGKEDQPKTYDAEYVEKLKKEAIDNRKALERYQKAEEERRRAEMTETERLKADLEATRKALEETQARQRQAALQNALIAEAAKPQFGGKRFADPSIIVKLAESEGLTVADDGTVEGALDAVKAVVKKWPNLLETEQRAPTINADEGRGQKKPDQQAYQAELKQRFHLKI